MKLESEVVENGCVNINKQIDVIRVTPGCNQVFENYYYVEMQSVFDDREDTKVPIT